MVEPERAAAAQSPAPLLEVSGLSAGYNGWLVLHDIALQAAPGEIIGVLGHNGAGKSTLLRTLAGLLKPARGRIAFGGHDIGLWPTPRRVAAGLVLVPQGRALFAEMSVRQNVRLGAFAKPAREAAAAWGRLSAADAFLAQREDTPVGRLSGGQQQIVANARGLASSPRLLMVDEPSLGLSGVAVAKLAGFLEDQRRAGLTVILVEQNIGLARRVCDRFLVLREGRSIGKYARDALPADKLWGLF